MGASQFKKAFRGMKDANIGLLTGDLDRFKEGTKDHLEGAYKTGGLYQALRAYDRYTKPEIPTVDEPVPDPVARPEVGDDADSGRRRSRKRSGRASTIQAGSLIPMDVGTKSLLA